MKKAALEKKPAMVILNPLNICVAGLPMGMIVFLIIFTMILMIILLTILMTTLMIIGMRERPGAPIIGPAGRLADRHQPGLCHHRQLCHHYQKYHHRQPRHDPKQHQLNCCISVMNYSIKQHDILNA